MFFEAYLQILPDSGAQKAQNVDVLGEYDPCAAPHNNKHALFLR